LSPACSGAPQGAPRNADGTLPRGKISRIARDALHPGYNAAAFAPAIPAGRTIRNSLGRALINWGAACGSRKHARFALTRMATEMQTSDIDERAKGCRKRQSRRQFSFFHQRAVARAGQLALTEADSDPGTIGAPSALRRKLAFEAVPGGCALAAPR